MLVLLVVVDSPVVSDVELAEIEDPVIFFLFFFVNLNLHFILFYFIYSCVE